MIEVVARPDEFERIKAAMGDRYEPRLDDAIEVLITVSALNPHTLSENIRVARMKLAMLDRLGLSCIAKSDSETEEAPPDDDSDGFGEL